MAPLPLNPLSKRIGRAQVERVIAAFYERLRSDPVLSPLFASVNDIDLHEQRVTDFWWIAMGGKPPAREVSFDMVGVHARLELEPQHFERWLEHFHATLADELDPRLASSWMQMAEGIASRLLIMTGHLQG